MKLGGSRTNVPRVGLAVASLLMSGLIGRRAQATPPDETALSADANDAAPATSAAELTRQGREHARNGDEEVAIRRFVEAIELDSAYGPAYLELAAARQRLGDWLEAERTYDVAIERVPQFAPALRARAALHGRLGRTDKQIADLAAALRLAEAPELLRDLAQHYIEARSWPAALGAYRRYLALMEKAGDERAVHDASMQIRALSILCAELDPVAAGATSPYWVRRAEASVARRRGI